MKEQEFEDLASKHAASLGEYHNKEIRPLEWGEVLSIILAHRNLRNKIKELSKEPHPVQQSVLLSLLEE